MTFTHGNGRFGPNFEFTANSGEPGEMPEPGTALPMLAGLGLVGISLRRRAQAA